MEYTRIKPVLHKSVLCGKFIEEVQEGLLNVRIVILLKLSAAYVKESGRKNKTDCPSPPIFLSYKVSVP